MRSYTAYSYAFVDKKFKFVTSACWQGLNYLNPEVKDIFIHQYKYPQTEKYVPLIVKTVNQITPCNIVSIYSKKEDKMQEYIHYKRLGIYNKDLLILNFIRNLWYVLKYDIYGKLDTNVLVPYNVLFFEYLKNSELKDPMEKLTEANVKAISNFTEQQILSYKHGHSNFYYNSKIRSLDEFKKWGGEIGSKTAERRPYGSCLNTQYFLTYED